METNWTSAGEITDLIQLKSHLQRMSVNKTAIIYSSSSIERELIGRYIQNCSPGEEKRGAESWLMPTPRRLTRHPQKTQDKSKHQDAHC